VDRYHAPVNDARTPEFPLAGGAQADEGRGWFAWARPGWAWGIPVLLLLGPFLLWPLGAILWRGFAPDGSPSLTAVTDVLGDGFYWERLLFTFAQALLSTALSLLVGLPAAYVFATLRFPGRDVLLAIVTVPFVLPTVVAALAFQELLGPGGWFNDMLGLFGLGSVDAVGTLWVILLAHVFYEVSIVIRLVSAAWVNLHPQNEEAARLLGAGRLETFRHVTLPALAPAIAAAAALVFTFTFTSFGVVLVLGGPGLDTLEVVIYRLATQLVALPAASVLAVVQIVTTVATLTVYALLQRRG
jgi:thiamine transport system permease protein